MPGAWVGHDDVWETEGLAARARENAQQEAEAECDQERHMRVALGCIVKLVPGIGGGAPRPVELPARPARHVRGEGAGLARGVRGKMAPGLAAIARRVGG